MNWTDMTMDDLREDGSAGAVEAYLFLDKLVDTYYDLLPHDQDEYGMAIMGSELYAFETEGTMRLLRPSGEEMVCLTDLTLMDVSDLLTTLATMEVKAEQRKRIADAAKAEERKRINRLRAREKRQLHKLGEW
jgi:hypothetical protein